MLQNDAPRTAPVFKVLLERALQTRTRGILISGVIQAGRQPLPGSTVILSASRRPSLEAVIRGYETEHFPPRIGIHIGGVRVEDLPIGEVVSMKIVSSGGD